MSLWTQILVTTFLGVSAVYLYRIWQQLRRLEQLWREQLDLLRTVESLQRHARAPWHDPEADV